MLSAFSGLSMNSRFAASAVFGSAVNAFAAFSLNSGRQLVVKFCTMKSERCIASRNGLTSAELLPLAVIISESMKPIVPSGGYADLSSGPPAFLTRMSVPRLEIPIAASPLAIIEMISLFCDASLMMFGLSDPRKLAADEIWSGACAYGDLEPVAIPPIAIRSVGMFSATIRPLYWGSVNDSQVVGGVLTLAGL